MTSKPILNASVRHLRAFLSVAHYRSFTRAAKELNISQPALTMAVRQLEDFVGTDLFDRTTRTVTLSPEGCDFLPCAERLIADFDMAMQDVRIAADRRRGHVAIASVLSVAVQVLPSAIHELSAARPSARFVLRDGNSSEVRHRVKHSEVDIGFCSREASDSDLSYLPLFSDEMGLLARRDHQLCRLGRALTWSDLAGYDFVGFSHDSATWPLLEAVGGIPDSVTVPRYEVASYSPLSAMLAAGNGITISAALSAPGKEETELQFCRVAEPTLWRSVGVVTRRGRKLSPLAEQFIAIVRRKIASLASDVIRVD